MRSSISRGMRKAVSRLSSVRRPTSAQKLPEAASRTRAMAGPQSTDMLAGWPRRPEAVPALPPLLVTTVSALLACGPPQYRRMCGLSHRLQILVPYLRSLS